VLFLQNCWDAERRVNFKIECKGNKNLIYPQETEFLLPAGAVMKAVIPVKTTLNTIGRFSLLAGVRVKNGEGSRIRRWHAQGHTPPVSMTTKAVAALLGGMLVWGGGLKFEGQIVPSSMPDFQSDTEQISPVKTEIIWM
jgi:hypothetical protein